MATSLLQGQETRRTASKVLEDLRSALEDEDFLLEIACWAWEHCPKFPYGDVESFEHKLEFTKLHGEYRALFEDKADEFLEKDGLDLQVVLEDIREELEADPGPMRALVDSLSASEDYTSFCRYMQNIHERRDWAEGKDLLPLEPAEEAPQFGAGK